MGLKNSKMTKDIRKNIDATTKLNESPVGWAGNKLAKAGGRLASKVAWGGTKQKLKKNVDVRGQADKYIKQWNTSFGARKMQRTPMNIIKFMSKHMKISREQLKTAWNRTPQLTTPYGTYDDVVNQLKGVKPKADSAGRKDQSQSQSSGRQQASQISLANYSESLDEGPENFWKDSPRQTRRVPATQKMSIDELRNLIINAIHVKNASEADTALGDMPSEDDPTKAATGDEKVRPVKAANPNAKPNPEAQPKPSTADLKKGGAKDMDGDDDYDWNDLAKIAVAQGKSDEALSSLLKAIDPDIASLVKQVIKSTSKGR